MGIFIFCHINTNIIKVFSAYMERITMGSFRIYIICYLNINILKHSVLSWKIRQWILFVFLIICHINANILKVFSAYIERKTTVSFCIVDYLLHKLKHINIIQW
jgi:hypothetical protein